MSSHFTHTKRAIYNFYTKELETSEQVYKNSESRDELLDRVQTPGAVSLPPHLFEQIYLGPKNNSDGKLRRTLGNPSPIGEIFPFHPYDWR